MKFVLEIELGNEGMQTPADVQLALGRLAQHGVSHLDEFDNAVDSGIIHDINGNAVGKWGVIESEPSNVYSRHPHRSA